MPLAFENLKKNLKKIYQNYFKCLFFFKIMYLNRFFKEYILLLNLYMYYNIYKFNNRAILNIPFSFKQRLKLLLLPKNLKKKKILIRKKKLGWAYPIKVLSKRKKKHVSKYYDFLVPTEENNLTYDLIINIKKKNLFLTFLDHNKNVLVKNNVGSYGFKKRYKFTNTSLQITSELFNYKLQQKLKFVINLLYNKVWLLIGGFLKKFYKKKVKKKKNYFNKIIFLNKKKLLSKTLFFQILKYRNIFRFNRIQNKKLFFRNIFKGGYLFIVLIYKTNPKNWPFRFVLKGLSWTGIWEKRKKIRLKINKLKICKSLDKRTLPHSNGLRIRKARRV